MKKRYFLLMVLLFISFTALVMGSEAFNIVYYAIRSFLRMLLAYFFSIIITFTVGILIMHHKKAYDLIFPILDILQGIPILGFFPFALLLFVHTFPGGLLGQEIASSFLIFTTMSWSIIFSVVESSSSITQNVRDLMRILNVRGIKYLTHVVFPTTYPAFISGSITGWGGGWYFLIAAEYLSLGGEKIALPGLGTFITLSAFNYNLIHSLIGLGALALIVLGMNVYVWHPLLRRARLYSSAHIESEERSALVDFLETIYSHFAATLEKVDEMLGGFLSRFVEFFCIMPECSVNKERESFLSDILLLLIFSVFLYFLLFKKPELLENFAIFIHAFHSIMRIVIAFILAALWTTAVAVFLGKRKKIMNVLMVLFDIGQSIPAVSLFPIIIVLIVEFVGGRAGVEIASILLFMTGMQWYLLFNLIRAVQSLPSDIEDLGNLLKLNNIEKIRHIVLPSLTPTFVVGGFEAIGGGWNASIVSEYIISPKGEPWSIPGLGFLVSSSSINGDVDGLIVGITAMTLIILLTNKFLWKPLIKRLHQYKF